MYLHIENRNAVQITHIIKALVYTLQNAKKYLENHYIDTLYCIETLLIENRTRF